MNHIARQRLRNHYVTRTAGLSPTDLVAWFGAVQAQDYTAAKWALGLRLPNSVTAAAIDEAFDAGRLLRTHVLRPTWHFVAPTDIHWMLHLTGPRVQQRLSSYSRKLGLDARIRTRAAAVFERALTNGQHLTRNELAAHLRRARLDVKGITLAFLTIHAELDGLICSGPRRGKHLTYALLAERAPREHRLSRDEALAELAARYLQSHAPATVRDFVWWSGLTTADARRAMDMVRAKQLQADGHVYRHLASAPPRSRLSSSIHLLPIWDEYFVAYRDRTAVPLGRTPNGTTFQNTILIDGQVAGSWKARPSLTQLEVSAVPFRSLRPAERAHIERAAQRYGRFTGLPVSVSHE